MRHPLARALLALLGLSLAAYLGLALALARDAERDTSVKSDVAIVLGARAYYAGQINPCLRARVLHAVKLLEAGTVRFVVLSGGDDVEDGVNEAQTMRLLALQAGAQPGQLLLEPRSTSTFENLRFSKAVLEQHKLSSAVLVSEPFHLPRAGLIARRLGLNFTVSPAPDSPCWTQGRYLSGHALREPIAVLENWLRGYL